MQYAVHLLDKRGYVFIGMDHFAKPEDELAIALKEGRLQRNFQGYSTYADCDLVAIGVSSIGKIGHSYIQNQRLLDDYYADLDANKLPVMRGFELSHDDVLRRQLIQDLMCRFALELSDYDVDFATYFAEELPELDKMANLGLIEWNAVSGSLKVTPKGRFVIRNIAMIFDYYLRHQETRAKYSQTV